MKYINLLPCLKCKIRIIIIITSFMAIILKTTNRNSTGKYLSAYFCFFKMKKKKKDLLIITAKSSYSYGSCACGLHLPQHQLKQQQQHKQQQQPVAQKQNIIKNLHHLLFANKYALKFSSPNCSANCRPILPY